ncbi:hypothetical protein ACHAW6_009389 [Cyclotella cf. meneghiniana]
MKRHSRGLAAISKQQGIKSSF